MNTLTRQGFCLCFVLFSSIFRGGATALCWGRCAACLGYYDAFATNGRAALRGESGCSPRKALPTALRSGWAAALSSRSVDIIAAGPSGVNKHAIHDYVRIVCGRLFFLQVGRRLRRCAWVLLRGADIGAAGHLLGSSQDTRHKLAVSRVSGDALL